MSEMTLGRPGPAFEAVHEVRARFSNPEAMQDAVGQLEMAGFDRAELSLPEPTPTAAQNTPEAGAKPVDTEEDARQARTLHTSGAAAVGAMAAAGVVIATGGAAAPAVAAAVVAGGLAGGVAHALSSAANQHEQQHREAMAANGSLILEIRTTTAERRIRAESIVRAAGAMEVDAR